MNLMISPWIFLQLALFLAASAFAVDIDNHLIGVPEIECHSDTIEMKFRTQRRFTGKIYVQGHYSNPDCRVDYSQTNAVGDPVGGIRLHHGSCDMDRQRVVQPSEGMQFSTVLVISFHPLFVTKVDRAFHINCLYKETARAVTAGLTVSPITPEPVNRDMPMPSCTYTIRKENMDGPVLRYAKVGDPVVHRWECPSDMYGMLVHSCYVEDGQGDKRLVIDERGCHTDRVVLGDPTYTEALNMAYRESFVFKFADRVGVRFSCEIKLCVKDSDGCAGITPPMCSNDFQNDLDSASFDAANRHNAANNANWDAIHHLNHSAPAFNSNSSSNVSSSGVHSQLIEGNGSSAGGYRQRIRRGAPHHNASESTQTVSTDLISQYVYVLDSVDDPSNERLDTVPSSLLQSPNNPPPICLSSTTFATVLAIIALALSLTAIVILHALFQHHRAKQLDAATIQRTARRFHEGR